MELSTSTKDRLQLFFLKIYELICNNITTVEDIDELIYSQFGIIYDLLPNVLVEPMKHAARHGRWDIVFYFIYEHYLNIKFDLLYLAYIESNLNVFEKLVKFENDHTCYGPRLFLKHTFRIYEIIYNEYVNELICHFNKLGSPKYCWIPKNWKREFLLVIERILNASDFENGRYEYSHWLRSRGKTFLVLSNASVINRDLSIKINHLRPNKNSVHLISKNIISPIIIRGNNGNTGNLNVRTNRLNTH
jgi:hypothetical protein